MKNFTAATAVLKRRLGSRVDTSPQGCWAASFDSSKISFLPAAVITPRAEADIGVVLTLANQRRVPVTVRGRGTTLMGSAAPVRGGWVIDMRKLNRSDRRRRRPGARRGGSHDRRHPARGGGAGWFYPPDPSSKEYCTIGGNIACNAGGMHGGKYGVTRDFVIALRGFLPTGEFVEWGTATKKFAAGFNLRDLWIGSEGMLGVVTGAVLKLIPMPAGALDAADGVQGRDCGAGAARALFRQRVQPAICEFLDRESVLCAERATGRTVFPGQAGRPVILLELAGSLAEVDDLKQDVLAWAQTTPWPSARPPTAPRPRSCGPCAASARARCSSSATRS
jgi:glycolate oxidase